MDSQFRILGPIEVELSGGRNAGVPRGWALSLLALLLVHRGTIVRLDRVVDELWGDAGPRNARNAVQVVASRLRAAVGDGVVVSEGGGYAVRLWPGALDADRFEERFRRGREELARGDPRDAAETSRDALGLWRGPEAASPSCAATPSLPSSGARWRMRTTPSAPSVPPLSWAPEPRSCRWVCARARASAPATSSRRWVGPLSLW